MSTLKPGSWSYAEEFVGEPELYQQARAQGLQLGATPVGTGAGAPARIVPFVAGFGRSRLRLGE